MQPTQTVTVERVSGNGNPIAAQKKNGKHIHIPAGVPGNTLEVQLEDAGSHWIARVVDRSKRTEVQKPRGATDSGSTLNIGEDFMQETFEEPLTIEQRNATGTELNGNEYPGRDHRNDISHRHD